MSVPFTTQQQFYDLVIQIIQGLDPSLTDTSDGSDLDILAGAFSLAAVELTLNSNLNFNKTFFNLANGPEVTGGPDDLQTLATDHFGSAFGRPDPIAAIDTATFSRPSGSVDTYGAITIPVGTVIKTQPDANGTSQRYTTNSAVTLTNADVGSDTSVSVNITAIVAGAAGDATSGTINVIESSLLDPTITVTNSGNATGEDSPDDAVYRALIQNLIEALAGATTAAVEASAKTVPGVVTATAVETAVTVIQYDPGTAETSGTYFRFIRPVLYIADSTGTASPALVSAVLAKLQGVRACGVVIEVQPATAVDVDWTASITLNPLGPNYSTFVNNPQQIIDSMTDYINNIPVGTGFVRATANAAILAIWGAAGTNDLTAFTTSVPSGDISATATDKMHAATVGLA